MRLSRSILIVVLVNWMLQSALHNCPSESSVPAFRFRMMCIFFAFAGRFRSRSSALCVLHINLPFGFMTATGFVVDCLFTTGVVLFPKWCVAPESATAKGVHRLGGPNCKANFRLRGT